MINFFSSNIEYFRTQRGATQKQMADEFDLTPGAWGNYERGQSVPNLDKFCEIAKFFGVKADDLLFNDLREGGFAFREPPEKYETNEVVTTQRQTIRTQEDMITMLKSALEECKKRVETLKKEIPAIDQRVEGRAQPGSSSRTA